ncbi:MAG TPA: N-acetylmuramoyl-L-alanine amidase [Candidatus Bipolaricaulota bacterium]
MRHWVVCLLGVALCAALPSATLSGARAPYVVVLDAGHGGKDPGAKGSAGTLEKDLVLQVAKIVRLRSFAYPQLQIVLTRTEDVFIELTDRTSIANRLHADLYVSIHANAHNDPKVQGVETLLSDRVTGQKRQNSLNLAQDIQTQMIQRLQPVRDRGVKSQQLYLRHADMPSALVELGFLTNPAEEAALLQLSYQVRAADAILQGILNYLDANR